MLRTALLRTADASRQLSTATGLPYRIRVPLSKLQERKNLPQQEHRPPALGDGEQLETSDHAPDYVRLALTSRVYDMVSETPLQYAPGLSHRLKACVHIKREDLLPSFSYRIRGAFNSLDSLRRDGVLSVVTFSVGSQGHSLAVAAQRLGMDAPIVVMPERTPLSRRAAISRAGAKVVVHGKSLLDAQAEAERLAEVSGGKLVFVSPHDDPLVIAGQATCGLEISRQHSAALETATGNGGALDAIFVCTGGSSLLAGVAAAVKQIMPTTKVIGVEPEDNDLLEQSLLAGHRKVLPEPSHFVDGAAVQQVGPEVFRLCDELIDDIVKVSNDEICAAVRDCFEDTRAMLEPAGAISVAGLKRWLHNKPKKAPPGESNGNYVVVSSDASNLEFDILRFIAERASMGEQKERLFALELPDEAGAFYSLYSAVQPRAVTEFVYRFSPSHTKALVYMCVIQADDRLTAEQEVQGVVDSLRPVGVTAVDVTGNEMAKTHARYLAGGRPGSIPGNASEFCASSFRRWDPGPFGSFSLSWARNGSSRCSTTATTAARLARCWPASRFRKGRRATSMRCSKTWGTLSMTRPTMKSTPNTCDDIVSWEGSTRTGLIESRRVDFCVWY